MTRDHTLFRCASAAVALSVFSGCSAIGAGIGSMYPISAPTKLGALEAGDSVAVKTGERTITGAYVGADADAVVILADRHQSLWWVRERQRIEARNISEISKVTGSHWATGFAIGLAIDLTLTALIVACAAWASTKPFGPLGP